MFKRKQPKIKSIGMAASGDFVFTFGLGRDGKIYSWNAVAGSWQLHMVPPTPPAEETSDAEA